MLFLTNFTHAQRMRMSVEDRVKILKDSLKLSNDQTIKITKLLEDQREEMTNLRNEYQSNREALQSAMQTLREKTDESIKTILTEDQGKKFDNMIKMRRERMERRTRDRNK